MTILWISLYAMVVPLVGTWIEIEDNKPSGYYGYVVPLVGTWIEIIPD